MNKNSDANRSSNTISVRDSSDDYLGCDLASENWQVPEFRKDEYAQRKHDYCVVIPVINEGERIGRLLRNMADQGIAQIADIILVDGGSTDGSLADPLLRDVGVSVLLTKTGPGKLSSQLRCAYAYAIRRDYAGIVTIDGNDKDDPEAIPRLIDALKSGVDFVQASRFIEGGGEENTPKLRRVAIRFLHAPLLSWSSGFHWTDTTQGYRAYSRRMLLDPRIQPFRDEFSTYELLAYLSHRVPRLGFRCCELPAVRRYPATGKTPTQISSVRGNLGVLENLFTAALGGYDPEPIASTPSNVVSGDRTRWPSMASWVGVFFVVATFYLGLFSPVFSPDSWSYLELSDSVFTDFYRVSAVRQFESTSLYSTAFPPLWPVCLAVARQIFDLGIYTGYLLNFVICLAILPVVLKLNRQLKMPTWTGHAIFLLLIALPYFRTEMLAARSIPLSILLIGGLFILLLKPGDSGTGRAALMGLTAGLACLNRFDFLLAGLSLGAVLVVTNAFSKRDMQPSRLPIRAENLSLGAAFYAIFFATLSPWFYYCYTHFGTPLASDNARQVYGATLSHVCNFYSTSDPLVTLWNSPGAWIAGLFTTKITSVSKLGIVLMAAVPLMAIGKVRAGFTGDSDRRFWFFSILIGALAAVPIMLTGYGDSRYFVLHFLLTMLMGTTLVLAHENQNAWVKKLRHVPMIAAIAFILLQGQAGLFQLHTFPQTDIQTVAEDRFSEFATAIREDVAGNEFESRVLIASGADACQLGAIAKLNVVQKPFNFQAKIVDELVQRFQITHVLDIDKSVLSDFQPRYTLEPLAPVGLYRIQRKEQVDPRIGKSQASANVSEY